MSSSDSTILETRFKERLQSLSLLLVTSQEKRKRILIDKKFRDQYTNDGICRRYQEENGETAPPLLLRQYCRKVDDISIDILEAKSNLSNEYTKMITNLCTFTEEEIKYIIETHSSVLTTNDEGHRILCNIKGVVHTLKYFGDIFDEKNNFFLSNISDDTMVPIFGNKFLSPKSSKIVFLKN